MKEDISVRRFRVPLAMLVFATWSTFAGSQGFTALKLRGDVGSYPGSGATLDLTEADGDFAFLHGTTDQREFVQVSFAGPSQQWRLSFTAPLGAALVPGVYLGALSYSPSASTTPAFDVMGNYASCSGQVWGHFIILEAQFHGDEVASFAADFEQHCNEVDPNAALFGSVRYHSTVDLGPRVSVAPAAVYEGDSEPRVLEFPVMLSERAVQPVTVEYVSSDGTAIAGTDYQAVTGTVGMSAGDARATVSVPVIPNAAPQPDRTLKLSLHNPVGASIGFGEATGTIVDDDAGRTFLYFQSDPGDYIGRGRTWTLTPFDGTITASAGSSGIDVIFRGFTEWYLNFRTPAGFVLVPGVYDGATGIHGGPSIAPQLMVDGEGRGCNILSGRFVVLEAQYGPAGNPLRLAVDFEQHCEGAAVALFGSVRVNSTMDVQPRICAAPAVAYEGDGEPKMLRFWLSLSGRARTEVTVDYSTFDATARAGTDYTPVFGTARFPPSETTVSVDVPILGNMVAEPDRTFRLALSNAIGAPVAFGQAIGTIVDDDWNRTFVSLRGDPVGFVGSDGYLTMTPLDSIITATPVHGGVQIRVASDVFNSWYMAFVNPSAETLEPGVYEGATTYSTALAVATPTLWVSGRGIGWGEFHGRFVVLDAQYGAGGEILSLAIDFEVHAGDSPVPVFGTIRVNSAIRRTPRISVAPAAVYEGDDEPANLGFWVSLSESLNTAVTVDYVTVDGSGLAGTDYTPNRGTVTFAPGVTAVRVDVRVLGNRTVQPDRTIALELANPVGATLSFERAVGTTTESEPLLSFTALDSDEGDYIGLGKRLTLRPLDGFISAASSDGAIRVVFSRSTESWWTLGFAPPVGKSLAPGIYEDAVRYLGVPSQHPSLEVSGESRGCNTLVGRFQVLDLQVGSSGEVESFAVDFEQHCEGQAPALFGSVRYRSSLPANPRKALGPRVRRHLGQSW